MLGRAIRLSSICISAGDSPRLAGALVSAADLVALAERADPCCSLWDIRPATKLYRISSSAQ